MGIALKKIGHDITVCTTNLESSNSKLNVAVDEPVQVDGITVYYEDVPFMTKWGFAPKMGRRIRSEISKADLIICHFHFQYASFVGGRMARRYNKPYVVLAHGSLKYTAIQSKNTLIKKAYLRLFEKSNFNNSLFVGFHSPEEMEESLKWKSNRIVSNGIDPSEFNSVDAQKSSNKSFTHIRNQLVFIYVGRLSHGKGLEHMILAMKDNSEISNIHLLLVGGDEKGFGKKLKKQIYKYGLDHRVTITGLLTGADKLEAFSCANVFILPSRSEGLSIAMLEAMYCRLPVLVSNRVGLWREIKAKECGVVCNYDRDDIRRAMIRMAERSDLIAMGNCGRKLIESKYTWSKIALDFVNMVKHSND